MPATEQSPDQLPARRLDRLAIACVLLWSLGAGLTPIVGLWFGMGAIAIGLGIASLVLARDLLFPLLQPRPAHVLIGLAAGFLMLGVTYGLYPPLSRASTPLAAGVTSLYAILAATEPRWITDLMLPFIIVAEELVWRGVVFEALRRRFPLLPAILLSTALYAAGHAPVGSPLLVALCLLCGVFWTALRAWTGGLLACLLCHMIWDVLVFALRPLA
jgi:membrane protease YdiL (CAAX protease family)